MHTLAVAGHICLDLTPALGPTARLSPGELMEVGPLTLSVGGCVANTTRVLGALGSAVVASGLVGDDEFGHYITRTVAGFPGVTGHLTVRPGRATSYSLVLEPAGTDRTFWHHTGVNAEFTGDSVDLGADLLHLGYPSLLPGLLTDTATPLVELLTRAKGAGLTTSLDLAVIDPDSPVGALDWSAILQRVLPLVDIISPSVDDLMSALQSAPVPEIFWADRLVDWGAGVAAVSAGADGLHLQAGSRDRLARGGRVLAPLAQAWADATVRQPPLPGEQVTTNGAGDACTAGLLYALDRGADPAAATQVAVGTAATVVAGRRPSRDEVLARIPHLRHLFTGATAE